MIMKNDVKRDEWLGAVNVDGKWHLLALYTGEWILDYPTYDPFSDKSEKNYRKGLWVVDQKNAQEFINAMRDEELSSSDVKELVKERGVEQMPLLYVVDFEKCLFVDGHHDRDIEEYVPKGWKGIKDFPLKYVPDEIKSIWTQNN